MIFRSLLFFAAFPAFAQNLDSFVQSVAQRTAANFPPALNENQLAITLIDLNDGNSGSYRGDVPIYPASVVKLFYLVAAHAQLESKTLADSPELQRAIHDMIVDSNNDATGLVVDALTGTTGGPELAPAEFKLWMEKRNSMNRYFTELGYKGINTNQKAFAEGPYGRERQARGLNFENNNRLTTNATARLLQSILKHQVVTSARCDSMLELMHRDLSGHSDNPDNQAHGFSGKTLPPGSRYYSKAGWTSTTRHDATYIELPNGSRYIAVIFTVDNSKNTEIIPFAAKLLVDRFYRRP